MAGIWQKLTAKHKNVNYITHCMLYSTYSTYSVADQQYSWSTAELHLSGLTGKPSHPDMQKIGIIGFFFENRLHWQFAVLLLLFTVCTCVWTFRPRLIWSSRSYNNVLWIFSGDNCKVRYTNQIRTRYRNWRTSSGTQLQLSKSLCYIGYTSKWWQHDCWLTVQTLYAIYKRQREYHKDTCKAEVKLLFVAHSV